MRQIYSYLEEENFSYAIRLKSNAILQKHIAPLLTRPVGRPSRVPKVFYASFPYQAVSWQRARRVVAKVEWHAGELFARVGFIVTNLNWQPKNVVKFYNHRGTAEQWIKEGKHAKYITFQMAEVAIPREMFRTMLRRVERLRLAPDTG